MTWEKKENKRRKKIDYKKFATQGEKIDSCVEINTTKKNFGEEISTRLKDMEDTFSSKIDSMKQKLDHSLEKSTIKSSTKEEINNVFPVPDLSKNINQSNPPSTNAELASETQETATIFHHDGNQDLYTALLADLEELKNNFCNSLSIVRNELATVVNRLDEIEFKQDELLQHARRTCLLIHGISENPNEDTDVLVMNFFEELLNIKVTTSEIDESHRLGSASRKGKNSETDSPTPRPIFVRLQSHRNKVLVYQAKSKLKGKGFLVTEYLTTTKQQLFLRARKHFGPKQTWTMEGNIFAILPTGRKIKVNSTDDLK